MSAASTRDENQVEFIIPAFLEKTCGWFRRTNVGDVSHVYNIKLKSMDNRQLFVDNEEDLRDILMRYLLYKKLCRDIQEEMDSVIQEIGSNKSKNKKDQSKKKVTKTKKGNKKGDTVKEQSSVDHGSQTFSEVSDENECSHDCRHRHPQLKKKKKCCGDSKQCCIIS